MPLKDRTHLEKAEAIFSEIGAEWDLGQARKLLKLYGTPDSSVERRSEVVQRLMTCFFQSCTFLPVIVNPQRHLRL